MLGLRALPLVCLAALALVSGTQACYCSHSTQVQATTTQYQFKFTTTTSTSSCGKITLTIRYQVFRNGQLIKQGSKDYQLPYQCPVLISKYLNQYRQEITSQYSTGTSVSSGSSVNVNTHVNTNVNANVNTNVNTIVQQQTVTIPQSGFFQHFYYKISPVGGHRGVIITYKAFFNGQNFLTKTQQYTLYSNDIQSEIQKYIGEFSIILSKMNPPNFAITYSRNGFQEQFSYFIYNRNGQRLIDMVYKKFVNGNEVDTKSQTRHLVTYTMGEINKFFEKFSADFSSKGAAYRNEIIPRQGYYGGFTFTTKWFGPTLKMFCFFNIYKDGNKVATKTQTFIITQTSFYTQVLNFFKQFRSHWTAELKEMESKAGQQSFIVSGSKTYVNVNGQHQFLVKNGQNVYSTSSTTGVVSANGGGQVNAGFCGCRG